MKLKILLSLFILNANLFGQTKAVYRQSGLDEMTKARQKSVTNFSQKVGITPLANKKIKNGEAELRLWTIINRPSIYWFECFTVLRTNAQMDATYIVGTNQHKKFGFQKFDLSTPKSGWENLNGYLEKNSIDFDLQLMPEKDDPDADGEEFVIEAKVENNYNFYYYKKVPKTKTERKFKIFAVS